MKNPYLSQGYAFFDLLHGKSKNYISVLKTDLISI